MWHNADDILWPTLEELDEISFIRGGINHGGPRAQPPRPMHQLPVVPPPDYRWVYIQALRAKIAEIEADPQGGWRYAQNLGDLYAQEARMSYWYLYG